MSTEEQGNTQTPDTDKKPEPVTKAPRGAPKAHVAPTKGKSAHKASPGKKAPKKAATASKKAKAGKRESKAERHGGAREGSKTAQILSLLKRPGGATLQEIMKVSEWQPHSVRGFISGTLGKKMGLTVESTKDPKGERTYSIKA